MAFEEKIVKTLHIPAYIGVGIGLVALGFFVYKSILDSTKVKLEIKKLRRDLGDNGDDTFTNRVSRRVEKF